MKGKNSIVKLFVALALIAGLLITGYVTQAAALKASSRPAAGASRSAFVSALKVEAAVKQASGALKSDAQPVEVKNEIQPNDDKGGLTPGVEKATAEPEPTDDRGVDQATPETEPTDDRITNQATPEAEPTDDRNLVVEPNENEQVEDNHGQNEVDDDNNVAATPQPGGKIEFSGQVTAINGNVLTVNGMSVVISAATEVKGDPQIGVTVRVEGLLTTDGSIQAREVKLRESGDNRNGEDQVSPAINPTAQVEDHGNPGPVDTSNPGQNNSNHDGHGNDGSNHDGSGHDGNGDHGGHDGSGHH